VLFPRFRPPPESGALRCGLPAEVEVRYTMDSTEGPLESAKIRCPRGHHFNGPLEFLAVPEQPATNASSASLPAIAARPEAPLHHR
jgi:hypothetical protein